MADAVCNPENPPPSLLPQLAPSSYGSDRGSPFVYPAVREIDSGITNRFYFIIITTQDLVFAKGLKNNN
jgi:hypothetical protein